MVFGFADSVYTALFTTVDAVNMGTHNMPMTSDFLTRTTLAWATLSPAQKILCAYGLLMALALPATWLVSWGDLRQLREVGIWAKPMKFMAATAAFAWTTVWLSTLAPPQVGSSNRLVWIVGLIITTSFFEVAYISWQAAMGSASHYNISDPLHAALFGLMGVAAVGLVASQAWLAWEIVQARGDTPWDVRSLAVVLGLVLTFVLSTVSGFLLGGHQAPAGVGWPVVGWHGWRDLRPSHFLAVHAQQFIPLAGLLAERLGGGLAMPGLGGFVALYLSAWAGLSWMGMA